MKTGIELITEERQRQISIEGYDAQHDSYHSPRKLIQAANTYVDFETAFVASIDHFDEKNNYGHWPESDLRQFAKHFFELGLQVQPDKELVEEIYSHINSIKDTSDRMTSGNFMHHRAAIKFSANVIEKVLDLIGLKAQKGEQNV